MSEANAHKNKADGRQFLCDWRNRSLNTLEESKGINSPAWARCKAADRKDRRGGNIFRLWGREWNRCASATAGDKCFIWEQESL